MQFSNTNKYHNNNINVGPCFSAIADSSTDLLFYENQFSSKLAGFLVSLTSHFVAAHQYQKKCHLVVR